MKLKNIYKISMVFIAFFSIFPLFAFVSANILGHLGDCGAVINTDVLDCEYGIFIAGLFSLSWYWVITLPIGLVFLLLFYFLFLTVRRK